MNACPPLQLTLDDIPVAAPAEPELRGLERIGETTEFRSLLLDLLRLNGWTVDDVPAFAGEGRLLIARRGPFEVRRQGATVADVAVEVFKEASQLHGAAAA